MLNKITIDNFKSLKHLEYDCAGLNLLTGMNGAGKSSFIQMLRLMKEVSLRISEPETELIAQKIGCSSGISDIRYCYAFSDPMFSVEFSDAKNQSSFKLDRVLKYSSRVDLCPGTISVEVPNWHDSYKDAMCAVDNYILEGDESAAERAYKSASAEIDSIRESIQKKEEHAVAAFHGLWRGFRFIDAFRDKPREVHKGGHYGIFQLKMSEASDIENFDSEGQSVIEYLYEFKRTNEGSPLLEGINACLSWVSPGARLVISKKIVGDQTYYVASVDYGANGEPRCFKPDHVGFGISYILPVLAALLAAQPGNVIVIENPEAHLHPRGQAEMGKLIAETAARGVQLFVETHSDHVINGIRVAVKKGIVKPEDVNIAFFERAPHDLLQEDGTTKREIYAEVKNVKVDANGSLSEWPKDFMDEWGIQQMKLLRP